MTAEEIVKREPDLIIGSWCGKRGESLEQACSSDGWHLTSCNPATQITAHLRRGPERTGGPGREAT